MVGQKFTGALALYTSVEPHERLTHEATLRISAESPGLLR